MSGNTAAADAPTDSVTTPPTPATAAAPSGTAAPAQAEVSSRFSQRYGPTEREEKLKAALTQCGKAAFPAANVPPDVISYGVVDFDRRTPAERSAVFEHSAQTLQQRGLDGSLDLGNAFPQAARAVARAAPNVSFYLQFSPKTKPVPFELLRAQLGREDAAVAGGLPLTADTKLPVTWHVYGWCGFGVDQSGKVVALQADCKSVTVEPAPTQVVGRTDAGPGVPSPGPRPPDRFSAAQKEQPLYRLRHVTPVAGATFAAGGELVSWDKEGTIRIWNVETGVLQKKHEVGAKGVKLTAALDRVAPLGPTRWLLLLGGQVLVWDSVKGSLTPALPGDAGPFLDWHVSGPDSALFLTRDQVVYGLRKTTKPRPLGKRDAPPAPFNPNLGVQPNAGYRHEPVGRFSSDGRHVLWAFNNRMWLFDVATGKELHRFDEAGFINTLAISANGSRAITGGVGDSGGPFNLAGVVGGDAQTVRVWDLTKRKLLGAPSVGPDLPRPFQASVGLSADGKRALVCTERTEGRGNQESETTQTLWLLEVDDTKGRVLDQLSIYHLPKPSATVGFNLGGGPPSPKPPPRSIDAALFSPNGRYAVSYGTVGTEITVWKLSDSPAPIAQADPVPEKPVVPPPAPPPDPKPGDAARNTDAARKSQPGSTEIEARLARGGSNWTSFARCEVFPDKQETEGTRMWIWPETDELIVVKRGAPKLTLAWSLRPGEAPLAATDLNSARLDFFVRTPGQFHGFGGQIDGWRAGDTKGTLRITPGPKVSELAGEGEFTIFLHTRGKALANILKVKIKMVD